MAKAGGLLPPLRGKQKLFMDEMLVTHPELRMDREVQLEAMVTAGYKAPSIMLDKLLQHPTIRATLMSTMPVKETVLRGIDDAWVLAEGAHLWDTPLSDLFDEEGVIKPIHEMSHQAQKLVAGFDTKVEYEYHGGEEGEPVLHRVVTTKIKLIDRLRVLEMIGRNTRVNAFGDKEKADAAGAFAELLRAASAAAKSGKPIDVEQIRRQIGAK